MAQRLELFRRYSEGGYQALLWFRSHKHLFHQESYEPMYFQLNFHDEKYRLYLENTINDEQMMSFLFVNSQDMTKFLNIVNNELKLHGVCATKYSVTEKIEFKPDLPINNISHLGFYTYLHETFTAPTLIYNYLCDIYNIHNIPIGNEHTRENYEDALNIVSDFYTDTDRVTQTDNALKIMALCEVYEM